MCQKAGTDEEAANKAQLLRMEPFLGECGREDGLMVEKGEEMKTGRGGLIVYLEVDWHASSGQHVVWRGRGMRRRDEVGSTLCRWDR